MSVPARSARSATFPDDKTVVLGLVSTKFDRMEPPDQLAARISEASGFFPLEQLALSTQCGSAAELSFPPSQ